MRLLLSSNSKRLFLSVILILTATFLLTACSLGGSNGTNTTPTAQGTTSSGGNATPTTAPGIGLGSRPCPDAVKAATHWDPIIPTQSNISKVETVSCGNLIGNTSLQALVTVR